MRTTRHAGVFIVALTLAGTASAQTPTCDPDLPSSSTHPYGYRARGDRCEGVYIQEVGLATLLVSSLTESFEDFDPAHNQDLQLDWTGPRQGEVHIRAHGIGPRLYFRMDTTRAAGSASYRWPTGLLAGLGIRKPSLGVVAWTDQKLGPGTRRVYLPLRIRQRQEAARTGQYELRVVSGRELNEVFVHLARVRDDGTLMPAIRAGQALGYGYYPAGRGIPIPLSGLTTPGVYSVELGARLPGGENVTTWLYFYHADR
jgi:hypothetical protein